MSTQTTEDELRGELVHDSTWNGIRVVRADKQQAFGMKRGGALTMPDLKPSVPPSVEVTSSLLNTVVTGHSSSPAKTSQQRYPSDEYNNGHPDRGSKDTTSYSMRGKTSDKASAEATQDIPTSKWLDAPGGSSSFKSQNGANPRSERKDPASSWNSGPSTTTTTTPATGAGWSDSQGMKGDKLDWSQGLTEFPSDMKPSTMPVTTPSEPDPFPAASKSGPVKSGWGKEQGDEGYGQQKSDDGWSKKGENAGGRRPSDSHSHSSHDQRGGRFTFSSVDGSRFPGPGGHPQDKRSMNSEDRYNSRRDQGNDNNSDNQRNRRNDNDSYSAGGYGSQRWNNNNHYEQNQRGSHSGAIPSSTNLGGRKPFKEDSERGSAMHAWAAAASQQASKPGGNRGTETSSPTNMPLATASDFASFMQAAKSFVPAPSTVKKDPSSTAEGGHGDSTHDGVDEGHSVIGREQGLDDQAQPKQNDLEPEQEYEKRALEHDDRYPEEGLKTEEAEEAEEEEEERLERRPSKPSIANFDMSKEPGHHTSNMDQAGVPQEDGNLLSFEDQSRSTSAALTGPDDADNLPKEPESPAPSADGHAKDLVAPAAGSDIHLKDSEAPTASADNHANGLEVPALSADDHAASPEASTTNTDDHGNDLSTPSPITDNHPKDLEAPALATDDHPKDLEASATNTDNHSKDLETSVLGTDDHPKLETSALGTEDHPKDLEAPATDTDNHSKDLETSILGTDAHPKLETSALGTDDHPKPETSAFGTDDHPKDLEASATDTDNHPKDLKAPSTNTDDHPKDLDAAALDADGPPKCLETSVSADDLQKDSEAPAPNDDPKESEAPAPSVDDHIKGPENLSVTDLSNGPNSADDARVEAKPKIGQDEEAREAQEAQEQ